MSTTNPVPETPQPTDPNLPNEGTEQETGQDGK
jgi:hypothetical protein